MAFLIEECRDKFLFEQIEKDRYDVIYGRYKDFLAVVADTATEPVKVYDALSPKQLAELELIREVSRELQKKKIEDIDKQKAAQEKEIEESKERELAEKTTEDKQLQEEETPNEVTIVV